MDTRYALIAIDNNGQRHVVDCGVLPDAPDKFIHELLVKHNEMLNTKHVTKTLRQGIAAMLDPITKESAPLLRMADEWYLGGNAQFDSERYVIQTF